MALKTAPAADVTIVVSSSDTTEGTVSPASLTFTAADWDVPQTVTVSPVDDAEWDGDQAYEIDLVANSDDAAYQGLDPVVVSVLNRDNDVPGITVTTCRHGGLITSETGGAATFTVVLDAAPTADVTIGLSSSDPAEGTVSPAEMVFTPTNWQTPQTATVTGVDDSQWDGDQAYAIQLGAAQSDDPHYAGLDASDVRHQRRRRRS